MSHPPTHERRETVCGDNAYACGTNGRTTDSQTRDSQDGKGVDARRVHPYPVPVDGRCPVRVAHEDNARTNEAQARSVARGDNGEATPGRPRRATRPGDTSSGTGQMYKIVLGSL